MSKRRKILLLLAGLVLAFGADVLFLREKEPTYKGKPLSYWVKGLGQTDLGVGQPVDEAEASTALREIGAKAVPHLLSWMDYAPPPWRLKLGAYCGKHPSLRWLAQDEHGELARSLGAVAAFKYAGPEARSALPELVRRLTDGKHRPRAPSAARALANLGSEGAGALAACLTNRDALLRDCAVDALGHAGSNAEPFLAEIIQCLRDPDWRVRRSAAGALYCLKLQAARVVTALADALQDPDGGVRVEAAIGLTQFGKEARPAVPRLQRALKDADPMVRQMAKEALVAIAPEALSNAPPQAR
jgi:hypothetical protein